eukprot:gene42963-53675_t
MKGDHPFFLNQAPAKMRDSRDSSASSGEGLNYHYIMNRVKSSDSLSSLGNTSIDIQESQAVYMESEMDQSAILVADQEEDEQAIAELNRNLKPFVAKKKSLNIDFSTLPSNSRELISIFGIQLQSVFDG